MTNQRYKIRKEKNGAIVFDKKERYLLTISQEDLFLLIQPENLSEVSQLPRELSQKYFTSEGQRNFQYIDPASLIDFEIMGDYVRAPNRLYLVVTRECNLRCRMCYNVAGKALPEEMNTEQWKSLLDQMSNVGVFESRFTGGEAVMRKDFFEIFDHAINRDFYVSLATNGVWGERLREEVCKRRFDDAIISLDGPEEINDWFRDGGSFKETLKTLKALKQAGIKKVRINTVLSKINYLEIETLFVICQELDLLLIDFIHPRPFGRGESSLAKKITLGIKEILEFNQLVRDLRQKYPKVKVVMDFDLLAKEDLIRHPIVPRIKACPAGREFAFISPQGYMFPCEVAPVHDINRMTGEQKELFIAGNILENNVLKIWHCSPVWEPFRDLSKCKPSKCFSCQYWGKKCFGTCPIGAYYHQGNLNGEDPYCYAHLLKKEEV